MLNLIISSVLFLPFYLIYLTLTFLSGLNFNASQREDHYYGHYQHYELSREYSENASAFKAAQTLNHVRLASPRIVRIYSTNSHGIRQDAEIFRRALGSELNVEIIRVSGSHEMDNGRTPRPAGGRALVNLFLEEIFDTQAMKHAKFNWLMVNQEYLGSAERLKDIDLVLCKTKHATELMLNFKKKHGLKFQVYYTNFTALGEIGSGDSKNFDLALHAAGKSPHKNTGSVLRLWQMNPEYPKLIVTCRDGSPDDQFSCYSKEALPVLSKYGLAPNIDLYSDVVEQETLQKWQETAGYFVVPSSVEGYGYYIQEGRAQGAIVITTDAPPMNEMVVDGITGFLVPTSEAWVVNQSSGALAHNLNRIGFARVMERVLSLTKIEKLLIGRRAQNAFIAERHFFKNRIDRLVDSLVKLDDLSNIPTKEFEYQEPSGEIDPALSAEAYDVFAPIPQKTFGIVITAFNRPEYLGQTFASLKNTNLKDALVVIVDDASTDEKTARFIQDLDLGDVPLYKIRNRKNSGVLTGLLRGFDLAAKSTKYVLNIDSDVIMSKNWVHDLNATYQKIADPNIILTGFNTKSHPTETCDLAWCRKESIGGINFFMSSAFYESTFHSWFSGQDILNYNVWKNWDWTVVDRMRRNGFRFFTTRPSVIQHIGFEGLNANAEKPADVADDFIGSVEAER